MDKILSVIFMNFWGYDVIIFLAAVFNGFVYYVVKKSSDRLRGMMNHTVYVPHFLFSRRQTDEQVSVLREEEVLGLRATVDRSYSLFVNITGIFPLLGILGTVVSLLGLVSDMENVTGNFYGALTSTFWGLIFAIGFKFADGLISPEIEGNEKSVKMYLENIMSASEKNDPSGKTVTVQAEENDAASEPDISVVSPERPDETGPMPYSTGDYGGDEE